MNQENTNPYEDYYLEQLNANESQNEQSKAGKILAQHQLEEIYYRSLQEHFPKLKPIAPSNTFHLLRKRVVDEENSESFNNSQPNESANEQNTSKRQR